VILISQFQSPATAIWDKQTDAALFNHIEVTAKHFAELIHIQRRNVVRLKPLAFLGILILFNGDNLRAPAL
jgi:hypothetical protein